jgi:serine/threonine-protein kinase
MKLTAGTTLQNGKYLVNHVLGQGGSSITLKGTLVPLNHDVILKTLPQEFREKPNFSLIQQRFQEQVSRFARCQHPALVRLIDSFEEDGLPFAVMDHVSGPTLVEVVATKGSLSENLAIHYIQQVGSALTAIHQHGLIHRHVAPDHIIQPPGSDLVVLVNYELIDPAMLEEDHSQRSISPYTAIAAGHALQSLATPATDVYSLAATLYFLLTGQPPVAATFREQTPLTPPRQLRPELSTAIESAILSGLTINAKLRPQSVATWLALLPAVKPGSWLPADPYAAIAATPAIPSNGAVNSPQPLSQLPTQAPAPLNGKVDSNGNGHGTGNSQPPVHSTQATYAVAAAPKRPFYASVQPPQPITYTPPKHFGKVLLTISAIAAAIGLGAGILLRLAAGTTGPGSSLFHSEQAFPSIQGWPNAATPTPSPAYSLSPKTSIEAVPSPKNSVPPVVPKPEPAARVPEASPEPSIVEATPVPEKSPTTSNASPSTPAPSPSAEVHPSEPANSEPLPPPPTVEPPPPPTSVAPNSEESTPSTSVTPQ